jgi:thioredoxin 1
MKKIIRFTASWCQPCKMLAKTLEDADLGIPIEVIDIDVDPKKAIEFGIRSVPTMVLIDGENSSRLSGVYTLDKIKQWIEK